MNQTGVWSDEEKETGHKHSESLAKAIATLLMENQNGIVYDFGCGDGYYSNYFHSFAIDCIGFDGNPVNEKQDDRIFKQDLTDPIRLKKKGTIICLEVAEHIPVEYESKLINNIAENTNGKVIISWAVNGQGGIGHVNERENYYVIGLFQSHGFKINVDQTSFLRNNVLNDDCWWFNNTLLVFDKE